MIAGERISVGSLTEPPIRYFKQSLLLSVLIHGLITGFFVNRENLGNSVRVVPAQTVRSYLYYGSPVPVRSVAAVQESSGAAARKIVKAAAVASQNQSVKKPPEITFPEKKAAKNKAFKKKILKKKALEEKALEKKALEKKAISKLPSSSSEPSAVTSARDQFLAALVGRCNPTEKESKIRNCDDNGFQSSTGRKPRRFERNLAVLFKPPPVNLAAKFKRDLARVEQLTSELKHLDEMIESAGVESEFLRQQQRQLTDEIHRIDSEYQEINLLQVLGSGIKAVKKGYEAIRDKD